MTWIIEIDPGAEKELEKLDFQEAKRVLMFLFNRLACLKDPRSIGEALKGSRFRELWKYRVGNYRVISRIEDKSLTIFVLKIGNRKDIYRNKT